MPSGHYFRDGDLNYAHYYVLSMIYIKFKKKKKSEDNHIY